MAAPSDFGNWQKALDSVVTYLERSGNLRPFGELKSSEEKVKFVFSEKLLKQVQWLPKYFRTCKKRHGKSSQVAQVWKNKGNTFFKQKRYREAIDAYTESCLNSPMTTGNDLAISFGNRSAALFHMNHFQECLIDTDRALQLHFSSDNFRKLLLRKIQALVKLGKKEEAENCLQVMIESLSTDKSDSPQVQEDGPFRKAVKAVEAQKNDIKDPVETHIEEKARPVPTVSFGAHPIIAQASSAISLAYTLEKGRHILAKQRIPKKSTIIVEHPYAAVLLPDNYEEHCHHCFSLLPLTAIGCKQCTTVKFCNETCRDSAWSAYHRIECHYLDLLHSVGIAHLALRIILTAKKDFLLDFVKNESKYRQSADPAAGGINSEGKFDRSYLTVYDLILHEQDTDIQDLLQYSMTAYLLLTILIDGGFFNKEQVDELPLEDSFTAFALGLRPNKEVRDLTEEMYIIGGLLLKHTLQLVCNAHAIYVVKTISDADSLSSSNTRDTKQVRISSAIYPTASLLNHSCEPTIVASFEGDILIIRTIKDVEEGEEIFNCYGPNYSRMSRKGRQEVLKSQYNFECKCPRCLEGDVSQQRFSAFKCPKCDGVLNDQSCLECGEFVDDNTFMRLRQRAEKATKIYDKALQLMEHKDYETAISQLEKCIVERKKFLYCDHRDLALAEDTLAKCFASIGDYSSAADHLFTSIQFVEQMFGSESTEYAHELQKIAEVLFNAERFRECEVIASDCLSMFESLYSTGHEAVKQISDLKMAAQLALAPIMQAS